VKNDYGLSTIEKTITIGGKAAEKPEINDRTTEGTEKVRTTDTTDKKIDTDEKKPEGVFTTAGTVTVAPGIFGVQYFYLLPEYGEPLIQVYNSKKLFPTLKIGDQVIVTGEYSEPESGPRLKTKEAKDIQITGHAEAEIPAAETSADLKSPPYPRLSRVTGKIVSKKSPRIFLSDEQGEMEIYLSKNTGLKIADFTIGETISVSGILLLNSGTTRLQPRNKSDLSKIERDEPVDFKAAALPVTETEKISEEITVPEKTPNKKMLLFYLIAASLVIIGAVIYSLYKKK
jgi:DNA/RNA endonuclease YhcR with UshA esterase domain